MCSPMHTTLINLTMNLKAHNNIGHHHASSRSTILLHDIIMGISTKLSNTHESLPEAMRCQGYTPMRQTHFKSNTSKSDATAQIDDLTGNVQPTPSYGQCCLTIGPYYMHKKMRLTKESYVLTKRCIYLCPDKHVFFFYLFQR